MDKLELVSITSDLMPQGVPNLELLWKCKTIVKLQEELGSKNVMKAISALLANFTQSLNVVRNMDGDQIIECAAMMLDECDKFTLEDYQVMFTMAKRGTLDFNNGKGFMDRVDIQLISKIMDAYYVFKRTESERIREIHEQQVRDKREEQRQQRLLSSPNVIELPPDYFAKELKRLQDENEEQKQKDWADYIGRREQRKQEFMEKMAAAYGFSSEQLEKLVSPTNTETIKVKTVPSKINQTINNE